jgi:hypothetical protein
MQRETERLATFHIVAGEKYERVDTRITYVVAAEEHGSRYSEELVYYVCSGGESPRIIVKGWTLTTEYPRTTLKVTLTQPLLPGEYQLFAYGTLRPRHR